jgi:hypothetical protein
MSMWLNPMGCNLPAKGKLWGYISHLVSGLQE